jgi:Flp pilus assembly protein CpaB
VNPRQRRGALLLLLSVIGAIVVFVSVSNYVSDVRAMVGPDQQIIELTDPVTAFDPITPDEYRLQDIPQTFIPDGALSEEEALTLVAATDLPAGTVLQDGMLIVPPALGTDESEIAITVDVETGVGGNIRTGDYVDIYATFAGDQETRPDCETRLITDALILGVGLVQTESEVDEAGQPTQQDVVPVRFALDYLETERLVFAEDFASRVRLARVSPDRTVQLRSGAEETLPTLTCRVPPGIFEVGGAGS